MLVPGDTLSQSYPALAESVAEARNALTAFAEEAGVDQERIDAIRLAASEAVTNAVLHAYQPDRETGAIQIRASYIGDELWLLIADAGSELRPRADSPGLGLGLALIAQLADEFQILSRGSGGTELRLRFKLAPRLRPGNRFGGESGRGRGQSRGSVSSAFSPAGP